MDSVVLLHALCGVMPRLGAATRLEAVHVHHGLSPHAGAWADFCIQLCNGLAVPVEVVRVQVPRDTGEGLEAAARRLRHGVFAACGVDWLALAHHRDDQAETMLLNLLRGAGVAGAAGMLDERPQARGPALVRPLLDVPRAAIEAYAEAHGLRWIDDESNADRHFRRNFLRHEIFPRLEVSFPGAGRSLARAARHFAAATTLLDDLAEIDRRAVATVSGRLALAAVNALPRERARNLLRHVWQRAGFQAPDTAWIDEALAQLATADTLSEVCVATAEGELHVYRGEVHVLPLRQLPASGPLAWSGQACMPWAGGRVRFLESTGQGLNCALLAGAGVSLAPRQGGERLQPDARRPRRTLRNLLQEGGVPPWERPRLPFLWVGGRLAWVGGIGVDVAFACPDGEAGILPVWEKD
jgi:tRNA(Ile)-lysidine synthase